MCHRLRLGLRVAVISKSHRARAAVLLCQSGVKLKSFQFPAGPHWVREGQSCPSLKHNGAEFIFHFNYFDGGSTRARTLDPLIKRNRVS